MSPLKTSLLIAVLACVSACGRQVVEFRLADGDAGTGDDASPDGSPDAPIDGPIAVRPVVTSTMPSPGAMGVALNTLVTATFSKPMNSGTLTMATFTLRQGTTVLTGPVTMNTGTLTATLTPTAPLQPGLVYTAMITTAAMDTAGLTLVANHTWLFTAAPNALPPTVTSTMPAPGAMNVAIAVSPTATFSKAMNMSTINMTTFTLAQGATPIAGAVMLDGATNTATFDPTVDLTAGLVYTATITTGAQDTGGLALAANHTWMFTAGITTALPPMVNSTTPLPGAMNVALNVSPTAVFDQTMNGTTINMTTFTLLQGLTPIAGSVMLDLAGTTATFDPTADLTSGLVYTATITTGAQGTNGMSLAANHTWMFTAGTTMACVVPPIVLGTAGAFAVLAGSTVTNTGPSMVTGDLGVWPLTAVTGFPPGILIGTEYAGVTPAMTAQGDLTTAYNDAAGRTLCLTSIVGDLGGLTLPPGLYKSTSFLEITTGDLVLDAMGDANAVWIFSMASELTVANTRSVSIIGGGSAANVYWQVGSSAVIGTGAMMVGTIMADQAISFATGAVLQGRALARIAAVTLGSTTVVRP